MFCPYCDSDNGPTNAFCDMCGKSLGGACSACGHLNRANSRFCGNCSAPLGTATAHRPPPDEMLRLLSARGGERKQLTIVFADISNSTSLIDQVDPEDAMRRMQPAIDAMKRAVESYGGIVNKVQGDGVMALFGAPVAREDHAVRACAAALEIQALVAALGDPGLKVRVGINTGEVVVQTVENSLYQTYDVAGSAAHLASRMEQMAEPGGIILTADTVAATRQFIESSSLGRHVVRGLSEPIEVFRLLCLRHAPASEMFRGQQRLSRLIGRGAQLEALEAELASAANADARVVGVVGEAGAGKSRLCFEFAERCREREIRVYEARVCAHGHATPYQPVLDLLRSYLGIEVVTPPDVARQQVATVMARLPVVADAVHLLQEFLGIADPDRPSARVDPAVRHERLIELVRCILRFGGRQRPVVVLIEDLHWIDAASEQFVDAAVDAIVGTPTLLLFNFRPGYAVAWMQRSHYRQINLAALNQTAASELLGDLLGRDSSLALISRHIAERTQGNPFFIEELVRSLVERGDFEGERGAYRLTGAIERIPLPTTIESVLAARIDHLDQAARQVLQYASVIGREIPVAILERLSGWPHLVLMEALARLRQAELLRELPLAEAGLHAFCHPLIQEVCYRALLRDRRRKIHSGVANVMKRQFSSRQPEQASLLAFHLEEAGQSMEAAQAHIRAAMWIGTHDSGQALRTWKKVHQLLAMQPDSESIGFLRLQACMQIVGVFGWREGMPTEEAQRWFEEARQLALAAGNMRATAWAHLGYGRYLAVRGSADEYVARAREALDLAIQANNRSVEVMSMAVLCQALRLGGHLHEALEVNGEAESRVHEISSDDRQLSNFDVERWLTVMRGLILVQLGRHDEARSYLDRVVQSEDSNDITLHLASVGYADLAWATDDKALAASHAERIMAIATASGSPYVLVNALVCRGVSQLIAGRFGAAVDDFERALSFARSRKVGLEAEARILADIANAYLLNGNIDKAGRVAEDAIAVASTRAARIPECLARIVRAEVAMRRGDSDRARDELGKVRALAEETGAKIYQPLVSDLASLVEEGTLGFGATKSSGRAHNNGSCA
jgi:class 3 adenylate cyclase/tetratricopeptide (TPR) repeat protein